MPYVPESVPPLKGMPPVVTASADDRRIRRSARAHEQFTVAIDETETAIYRAALAYRELSDAAQSFDAIPFADIQHTCIDALYFGRRYLRTLSDQVRDNADLSETHRELLFDKIDLIRSQTADLI